MIDKERLGTRLKYNPSDNFTKNNNNKEEIIDIKECNEINSLLKKI